MFYRLFVDMASKITPYIRCDANANEIAEFYARIFPNAVVSSQNPFITTIDIFGQTIGLLNG